MSITLQEINKVFVSGLPMVKPSSAPTRLARRVTGTALSPFYAHAAAKNGAPGIDFQRAASRMAMRWLISNRDSSVRRWLLNLVGNPIVLTRYQEFDFAWKHRPHKINRYLDVSSPSIFPLRVMVEHTEASGILLNPDTNDLQLTKHLLQTALLESRCTTSSALVSEIEATNQSFDLITSLSVVEHIPEVKPAIMKMWHLLKPGGTLILTVPCAANRYALYTDVEHYGLLEKEKSGFTFFEYIFDEDMLNDFIFAVTDLPANMDIYGEVNPGFLRSELLRRWSGEYVRFWEEPVLMGQEFKLYNSITNLPGEGVACMSFVKPPEK